MTAIRRLCGVSLLCLAAACSPNAGGTAPAPQGMDRPAGGGPREVTVAAAADLKFAFDELLVEFKRMHPDIGVQVTFGSSGKFFSQLTNKAPFDIFFSADIDYPRQLVAAGIADPQSQFSYARGYIVLWVPHSSPLDLDALGIEAAAHSSVRRLAIANPRHAPYGRAAEAALRHYGVYERVKDRLVFGENVAQTAQFVDTGAADAGILALSIVITPTMRAKGRYWQIPESAHPPIEQGGLILPWAKDFASAEALRQYVVAGEGRAILRRYGFTVPGD